jgi:hypothetical protein
MGAIHSLFVETFLFSPFTATDKYAMLTIS